MAQFRPQIRVITKESERAYRNDCFGLIESPYKTIVYKTYTELRKNILKHLKENLEPSVNVSRSRRGEWGEYFEVWELIVGKPKIVKRGWM